jgi:hypothetical protein
LVSGALLGRVERLRENDADGIPASRLRCGRDAAVFTIDTAERWGASDSRMVLSRPLTFATLAATTIRRLAAGGEVPVKADAEPKEGAPHPPG